jgi:3',5'-cyclic AMP phosphodiesterase CpdA
MKDSLTFAVLTDIHLTESGARNRERLALDSVRLFEATRAEAEARGPDFIFYTGDLFEARTLGLEHLALARKALAKTKVPWFVLMGNHDVRYKTTQDAYDQADFIRAFEGHGPAGNRGYWSHAVPNSPFAFVGLHTARNFTRAGRIKPEQLAWLGAELRKLADRHVIAFMHHPTVIFDPVLASDPELAIYYLENHAEVRDLLVEHRCVKLVVSGHNHTRRHREISGLHFVGCPSINTWPNMYASFKVSTEKLSFDFRQIHDRPKVEEAHAGLVHPESTWLKGFKDGAAVTAYFASEPAASEFQTR